MHRGKEDKGSQQREGVKPIIFIYSVIFRWNERTEIYNNNFSSCSRSENSVFMENASDYILWIINTVKCEAACTFCINKPGGRVA